MGFEYGFFQGRDDIGPLVQEIIDALQQQPYSYRFRTHSHPYVAELVKRLVENSVPGLQAADTEIRSAAIFTTTRYDPSNELVAEATYPRKEIEFDAGSAYAVYNWELFYHVPLAIAIHLSRSQRFDEAQQWFHYIFDPTTDEGQDPTPERFWKVKPFRTTDVEMIEKILINLATPLAGDPELRDRTINCISAWKDAPFRPHVVARYRPSAYMLKTVMAYLDNLLAWGDSLFRQDTRETINEAAQIYVLAANILGPAPQPVPRSRSTAVQTYDQLRGDLNEFGTTIRSIEVDVSYDAAPFPNDVGDDERLAAITSLGNALYFCVPRNEKLLGYWDTIADRLFKIRNSLNIQGAFRQLALFEPPIDPALLARAAASGLDVAAIVNGVNQPLPLVRFQWLLLKALEICQEVKSMGNNLLTALEKEDNEALAVLRARHERQILGQAETARYGQWQEAIKTREGLDTSLANAVQRFSYYERLLGKRGTDIEVPGLDALDAESLEALKFKSAEPVLKPRDIPIDIAPGGPGTVGSLSSGLLGAADITAGKKISSHELAELDQLEEARLLQLVAANFDLTGSGLSLVPQFDAAAMPLGVGVSTGFGGVQLSRMLSMMASYTRMAADELSYQANRAAKIGAYSRREQEWAFQSNLAAGEINQILKQLRAAQIREFIAEREWLNHKTQIKNAEEIEQFLTDERTGKSANQALYAWMKREVRGLYGQVFQFAFEIAKKAERALQHELGDNGLSFLQFGYAAGREGLLAGEKLYLDLKRMEMAFSDLNRREYELTEHVSLLQLDPRALVELRATGHCEVFVPEELFDMSCPGHYFRRIKSVGISIPSVAGPYTSVNCTLTLRKSSIRKNPSPGGAYARTNPEDSRFSDHFGSLPAIVTSTGQNDTGLFETNLHDERYLPFEGVGAVSEWSIGLSGKWLTARGWRDLSRFDFDTISDVILHVRYTAREGGAPLRDAAIESLETLIAPSPDPDRRAAPGTVRLFSVRHEFPTDWAKFKAIQMGGNAVARLSLTLREEHYPFWSRGRLDEVAKVVLTARTENNVTVTYTADGGPSDQIGPDDRFGGLRRGPLSQCPLRSPLDVCTLYLNDNSMADLWLEISWAGR